LLLPLLHVLPWDIVEDDQLVALYKHQDSDRDDVGACENGVRRSAICHAFDDRREAERKPTDLFNFIE
jgi:hypothetical protein